MEKKLTAIQWLKKEYMKADGSDEPLKVLLAFDKAREMELDDLTDAYEDGYNNGYKSSGKSGYEYLLDNFITPKH